MLENIARLGFWLCDLVEGLTKWRFTPYRENFIIGSSILSIGKKEWNKNKAVIGKKAVASHFT